MFHLLNKFKASASQRISMFHPEEVLIRESQSRRGVVMPQCDLNTTGVITAVPLRPQAARRSVRWERGQRYKKPGESSPLLNTFLHSGTSTDWHMIHLQ